MEPNEIIRKQFLQTVANQLRQNDPPETKKTLERLVESGYTQKDAKLLIAQCVAFEVFNVMKNQTPFDKDRYV